MIVKSFLKWSETAKVSDRCRATQALTQAYAQGCMSASEKQEAEAALALLLEDPSPKVRLALAEGLAQVEHAPRSILLGLTSDQIEVAGRIIALSPVLADNDLIEIIAAAGVRHCSVLWLSGVRFLSPLPPPWRKSVTPARSQIFWIIRMFISRGYPCAELPNDSETMLKFVLACLSDETCLAMCVRPWLNN